MPTESDSVCTICGDTCIVVGFYGFDPERKLWTATRRCPDHGRHVEWLGSPVYAEKLRSYGQKTIPGGDGQFIRLETDSTTWHDYTNVTADSTIEIGLREDGTCVWRRQEAR